MYIRTVGKQAWPDFLYFSCYHTITVSLKVSNYKGPIMAEKLDIKKAIKRPGALRKAMGAKKGEPIDKKKMEAKETELREKKNLSDSQRRLLRQIDFAKTLSKIRPGKR